MIEPLSNDFGVPMRMSRSSSALLITAMASVLLMSGCKVEAPSMKIFVTYESPEPVDGGSTISTARRSKRGRKSCRRAQSVRPTPTGTGRKRGIGRARPQCLTW